MYSNSFRHALYSSCCSKTRSAEEYEPEAGPFGVYLLVVQGLGSLARFLPPSLPSSLLPSLSVVLPLGSLLRFCRLGVPLWCSRLGVCLVMVTWVLPFGSLHWCSRLEVSLWCSLSGSVRSLPPFPSHNPPLLSTFVPASPSLALPPFLLSVEARPHPDVPMLEQSVFE